MHVLSNYHPTAANGIFIFMQYQGNLSRVDFNYLFDSMSLIPKDFVIEYRGRNERNYSKGGFYAILNKVTKAIYIGKSINYMSRLRCHFMVLNPILRVDKVIKLDPNSFDCYLIVDYNSCQINFFNRFNETIIEQTFIAEAKTKGYELLNDTIYGHLQVI